MATRSSLPRTASAPSADAAMSAGDGPGVVVGRRWRRNLYEKTGLPDNFTPDDSFLAAIRRNRDVRRFEVSECAPMACLVSLQLSAVVVFYSAYAGLGAGLITARELLGVAGVCAALSYLVAAASGRRVSFAVLMEDLKHLVVFTAFGMGLSPVLYRLTDTISTDTIHTTSSLALLTHLLTHDYLPSEPTAAHYASANALSLNASLFAAVCLASRLGSAFEAFSLLAAAVIAFVLCPLLRTLSIDPSAKRALLTVAVALAAAAASTAIALATLTLGFGALIALAHLFIVALAPYLFVLWQVHKDTINGPWDEAVPNV